MNDEDLTLPAVLIRGSEPRSIDLRTARELVAELRGTTVTVDCETSGYPLGHRLYALRTAQVGNATFSIDFDAGSRMQLLVAASALDGAAEIVAHSASADVSLLALALGRDPQPWWDKTTDTMVLAALANPMVVGEELGLEKLSARLLPAPYKPTTARDRSAIFRSNGWLTETKPTTPLERSGWANIPIGNPTMVKYAGADILDTAQLVDVLPKPAPEVAARERRLHAIMARATERGLRLDADRVRQLTAEHTAARDAALATLRSDYAIDNPGSNHQLAAILTRLGAELPVTGKGNLSVAADVVEDLARTAGPASELAGVLLEYRRHEKMLGTYLLGLGLQCEPGADGRTHPTIHQLGARATGRMSSSNPNIQNWPRPHAAEIANGGGMRGMVVSDPRTMLISADFSSVEVRLAAAVTGDATLAHMLANDLDLHGEIVKLAWGLQPGDVGFKDARYEAKSTVFAYLYGAGMKRLQAQLGPNADKAPAVVDALKAITPQLMEWNRELRKGVENGTIRYWKHASGRIAHFNPELPHKALNTVVQGWGRELLVDSILAWEDLHPGCTVIPLHDELVIQVPMQYADAWTKDLEACMTMTLGNGDLAVPIICEPDPPTTRWGTVETTEL